MMIALEKRDAEAKARDEALRAEFAEAKVSIEAGLAEAKVRAEVLRAEQAESSQLVLAKLADRHGGAQSPSAPSFATVGDEALKALRASGRIVTAAEPPADASYADSVPVASAADLARLGAFELVADFVRAFTPFLWAARGFHGARAGVDPCARVLINSENVPWLDAIDGPLKPDQRKRPDFFQRGRPFGQAAWMLTAAPSAGSHRARCSSTAACANSTRRKWAQPNSLQPTLGSSSTTTRACAAPFAECSSMRVSSGSMSPSATTQFHSYRVNGVPAAHVRYFALFLKSFRSRRSCRCCATCAARSLQLRAASTWTVTSHLLPSPKQKQVLFSALVARPTFFASRSRVAPHDTRSRPRRNSHALTSSTSSRLLRAPLARARPLCMSLQNRSFTSLMGTVSTLEAATSCATCAQVS